ncbi:DUF3369 domain-containing protein [Azospirillum rugosum]|uniref:Response regulator RpfG family c-di-GMP phosphodiesterase n=1 Tax=Azospirillum rugosum TaxID=416170 RepID=A0ABS4SVQ5_9PROT|nr:DUF3369 domain-containing protein [Azospirillum rugosum]MBP2296656.1 response regulator RpfG family c-di-GMP phosphodiesterase [Azospirillum rugosum]MDQ0530285.1 response regulator RpfG family c-di-GMP phosphodiesterase [Azospirillum rugosum]
MTNAAPNPPASTGAAPGGEDDFLFLDDQDDGGGERESAPVSPANRWKMLIVDDEPEVHSITKLVLADFSYKGRSAHFLSAHSAAEAKDILAREDDIAIILLDVVMETDDAGLQLVHHIREVLKNRHVRIILRTGQPGQAPERAVILDYDINDYKAKTQLTAQQLFTTTVAALRSYEDIMAIEMNRRGLEKIIEASSSLFQARSMKLFAAGVLTQLSGILGVGPDAILCVQRGAVLGGARDGLARDGLYVLAGSGRFESLIDEPAADHIDPPVLGAVLRCLETRSNHYDADHCTLYIRTPNDRENVVYLRSDRPLSELDRNLIEVFCRKISVGFDNLHLFEQLRRTQQSTLIAMAGMAERGAEAPDAIPRIALVTERIARRLRDRGHFAHAIDEHFLESVGLAAILHDVGNATIDPVILGKAGPLSPEERDAMQRHTLAGWELLERASRRSDSRTYLHLGAEIARSHHENWDGTGYPDRLRGDAIPLSARIVAVADSFDAMTRERPYRRALDHDVAVAEVRRQSGTRFDPLVVEAFMDVAGDFRPG